ncbi:hypothetical protein ABEV34_07425 [Methylorubrum rhodesianum]|jgi:hypothetical protein|uniref:Uncharacterized protein n=1 Tax=Methylorubrum rhodesianum TaxID=29427 RepID=A0ABU9Z4A7_9HYPH|nr:hypothetical protein [Methylorubrum rhodesianum]MBB5760801.1 hypothetical protein [Methylorubrum rhodesianum]MBK3403719.1 hypothetical protein [Methylorubrum rhodesianum]MBY0141822.1 hypothetical protein [Methylorubrum populi]MRI52766.1 hypothetical protein [Methylobacterium sp. DB1607]
MSDAARGQLHTRVHDDVVGHAPPGTEAPDIRLKPLLLTGLFIVLFTAVTIGGLRFYYNRQGLGPLVQQARVFPAPRLQQSPEADLAAMLRDQRAKLAGYAWIDREKGIARMPIEEAMRRLAVRGNAAYAAPIQPERTPPLGSRGGASGPVLSSGAGPGTGTP